jgi:hypothetical protein
MKISQLKSLIKESIKEVLKEKQISTVSLLNENYRNSEENLDVLIKLLNKRKIASAIELIQNVKDKLEDNNLENAFDEAVEEFSDTGNRGIFYDSSGRNLNEDMSLVGDVALGVAGGLAGLWALVKGVPFVVKTFGNVAGQLADAMEDSARSARRKAARDGYANIVTTIATKLGNDSTLQSMYQSLPQEPGAARTKQLNTIAKYIKSKLAPEEMKYFSDVSSVLRTGDLTSFGKNKSIY